MAGRARQQYYVSLVTPGVITIAIFYKSRHLKKIRLRVTTGGSTSSTFFILKR